jgi:hypothetical protein
MKTITILAIVAILIAGLGAVTSSIPIHQALALNTDAKGSPNANTHAFNQGTENAITQTPANQPCAIACV